jgi:hypothetical protein
MERPDHLHPSIKHVPGFKPQQSAQQAGALPKGYSHSLLIAISEQWIQMTRSQNHGVWNEYISVGADWKKVLNGLPPFPLPLLLSFIEMGFNFPPIYLSGNREYIQIRSRDKRLPRPSWLREQVPRRLSGFREPVSCFAWGRCPGWESSLVEAASVWEQCSKECLVWGN